MRLSCASWNGPFCPQAALDRAERPPLAPERFSKRYRQRGYSSTEFVLRMTRDEIGSYLGLTLETVSRVFSHLQAQGAIKVDKKTVKLVNPAASRAMMNERE